MRPSRETIGFNLVAFGFFLGAGAMFWSLVNWQRYVDVAMGTLPWFVSGLGVLAFFIMLGGLVLMYTGRRLA